MSLVEDAYDYDEACKHFSKAIIELLDITEDEEFYSETRKSWNDLKEKKNVEGLKEIMRWVSDTFLKSLKECDERKIGYGFDKKCKYNHELYIKDQAKLFKDTSRIKNIDKLEGIILDHIYDVLSYLDC